MHTFLQEKGWATFWVIFFTISSGHPGLTKFTLRLRAAAKHFIDRKLPPMTNQFRKKTIRPN
jgi:hypothetical protein